VSRVEIGWEAPERPGDVVGAAELLDQDLELLERFPLVAGATRSVEVARAGRCLVRARLPSGATVAASFDPGSDRTVTLRPRPRSPRPIAPAAGWALAWGRGPDGWEPGDTVVVRSEPDRVLLEVPPVPSGAATDAVRVIQVGGDGLTAPMAVVPAGSVVEATAPGTGPERAWRLRLVGPDATCATLLEYAAAGDLAAAAVVGDELVRRVEARPASLAAELGEAFRAVVAAYHLLRVGDEAREDAWGERLSAAASWLPDASLLAGWLALGRGRDDLEPARGHLLDAARRGPPVVGDGLGLLFDGLWLVNRARPWDKDVQVALTRVRPYAAAAAPAASMTLLRGRRPDQPSPAPAAPEPPASAVRFSLGPSPVARRLPEPPALDLGALLRDAARRLGSTLVGVQLVPTAVRQTGARMTVQAGRLDFEPDLLRRLGGNAQASVARSRTGLRVTLGGVEPGLAARLRVATVSGTGEVVVAGFEPAGRVAVAVLAWTDAGFPDQLALLLPSSGPPART
jgi:hypothetical protein